ncbi:MAG: DUF4367 domain-containing protein [Eubacteriales bacterium]
MSKKTVDEILSEISQKRMIDVPEPDFDSMWHNIEKNLKKADGSSPQSSRWSFPLKLLATAAAVTLVFVVMTLCSPVQAKAIGKRFLTTLKSIVTGDLINEMISYSSERGKYPDQPNEQDNKHMEISEICEKAPFEVKIPGYLPPGYSLKDAQLSFITDHLAKVVLKYSDNQAVIIITEKNVPNELGQSIGYDNEDTLREEVEINNQKFIVITHKSGSTEVMWFENSILFRIESKIPKEQALKIASGLKKAG